MRFIEKAAVYWTPDRLQKVTGGKQLSMTPLNAAVLLRELGLLCADGSMPARCVRKYRQINHMLTLLLPDLNRLLETRDGLVILDGCCGHSYISFLVAWAMENIFRKDFFVVGIDRNERLINECSHRAEKLGWGQRMAFFPGAVNETAWQALRERVGTLSTVATPDVLLGLHACDTGTDDILSLGVSLKTPLIAVAPCCQAELAKQWKEQETADHALGVLFRTPNLRRETAASITDAMRSLIMQSCAYDVYSVEFVATSITPKNRLILCRHTPDQRLGRLDAYEAFRDAMGGMGIGLAERPSVLTARAPIMSQAYGQNL